MIVYLVVHPLDGAVVAVYSTRKAAEDGVATFREGAFRIDAHTVDDALNQLSMAEALGVRLRR